MPISRVRRGRANRSGLPADPPVYDLPMPGKTVEIVGWDLHLQEGIRKRGVALVFPGPAEGRVRITDCAIDMGGVDFGEARAFVTEWLSHKARSGRRWEHQMVLALVNRHILKDPSVAAQLIADFELEER